MTSNKVYINSTGGLGVCCQGNPHMQKDINTKERSQRQAARFVLNNFSTYASVSQMLTNLNWLTIAHCRAQQKAIMMFKIVNHLINIPASSYLSLAPTAHNTRGHNRRFTQPMTRVNSYLHSFFPSTIKIWNSLPQHVIDSENTD